MEPEFWHRRWAENVIHFHRGEVNPHLVAHLPRLGLAPGARVLLPLCGKSVDMRWLAAEGFAVLGVELSPIAAAAFFSEAGLDYEVAPSGPFERYRGGRIDILCGDFFDLEPAHCRDVAAVFDRAALVALPEAMRARYAHGLLGLVPEGAPILLVTLEYRQAEMAGPPFSVDADEVHAHFAEARRIEPLSAVEALDDAPHLREKGLSSLTERVWLLR